MKKLLLLGLIVLTGCSTQVKPDNGVDLGALKDARISNIVTDFEYDGRIKKIDWTDDNTGEDFIIKVDSKNHYGFGKSVDVYFSITNIGIKDTNASVVFSFGDKQNVLKIYSKGNDIKETRDIFDHQTEELTPTIITETLWNEISFGKPTVNYNNFNRKEIVKATPKDSFIDNFKTGETKFYRAVIKTPKEVKGDEWYIEVFGDNLYGHLDPNSWTYSETFDSLTTGELNGQDSWSCNSTGIYAVQTSVTAVSSAKAVKATVGGSGSRLCSRGITGISQGIVEYYFRKSETNKSAYLIMRESSAGKMYIHFDTSGNITMYEGGVGYQTIQAYSANTWYKVTVEFDDSAQADKYRVKIDNGSYTAWRSVNGTYTNIDQIDFTDGSANQTYYFDEICPEGGCGGGAEETPIIKPRTSIINFN